MSSLQIQDITIDEAVNSSQLIIKSSGGGGSTFTNPIAI
jgi:hypothetical protein